MRIVLTDSYLYLPTYMHGEESIRRKGEADDYRVFGKGPFEMCGPCVVLT